MVLDLVEKKELNDEIYTIFLQNPWMFEMFFAAFLKYRYNISLEAFDKLVQEGLPEEIL